jgi:hypothetical protein
VNVRLSVPTVRTLAPVPQAALAPQLAPSIGPSMAPSLSPASLAPSPVLSAPQLAPSAAPAAPSLALPSLDAAQRPADSPPAVLFAAGRAAFDSQLAVPAQDAVPASFSLPSPLGRAQASTLQGAVSVPLAAAPLAAADGSWTLLLAVGAVAGIFLLARLLPFNRPKAERVPLPRPPMPAAGTELAELRAQMGVLMGRLYASAAGIRDLRRAIRAIDAEWARLRADGGVAEWRPYPGEWTLTPIHGSLFAAIDLPDTLRIIERQGGGRNGDQLGDLLRGLSVEPERARSAEDLLGRLRWWNEHFRRFAPLR